MKKTIALLIGIGIIGALAGCGTESVQPVPIDEGVDICEVCNMSVPNSAFATELIVESGRVYKFDDIGCMQEWIKEHNDEKIKAEFVRDHQSAEWLDRGQAVYAFDPSFRTPMGYGVLSFKDKAGAEALIKQEQKGTLLTAEELKSHQWERHDDAVQDIKKQLLQEQEQKKEQPAK
ncbi:nitrous oxide reductase accessory protein NosL [Brevibacillus fluminis]|uniref:nitrous oxide reductase accessory protein NosL n=1 Tax=Brevibacillus fluminis TaxID=511487 RepID=UPI003F88A5A6